MLSCATQCIVDCNLCPFNQLMIFSMQAAESSLHMVEKTNPNLTEYLRPVSHFNYEGMAAITCKQFLGVISENWV